MEVSHLTSNFLFKFALKKLYPTLCRINIIVACYHSHSIKLVRDKTACFLHSVRSWRIRKGAKRVCSLDATATSRMSLIFYHRMTVLLSKFRIDYTDLVIISDVDEPPKNTTRKWFNGILSPFLQANSSDGMFLDFNLTPTLLEPYDNQMN